MTVPARPAFFAFLVLLRQPYELVDRLALALRPPTAASNGTSAKLLCFGVC
jgi:hypothetical protein